MEINQKRINGSLIALLKIFFNFPKKLFSPDEYNAEASKSALERSVAFIDNHDD